MVLWCLKKKTFLTKYGTMVLKKNILTPSYFCFVLKKSFFQIRRTTMVVKKKFFFWRVRSPTFLTEWLVLVKLFLFPPFIQLVLLCKQHKSPREIAFSALIQVTKQFGDQFRFKRKRMYSYLH